MKPASMARLQSKTDQALTVVKSPVCQTQHKARGLALQEELPQVRQVPLLLAQPELAQQTLLPSAVPKSLPRDSTYSREGQAQPGHNQQVQNRQTHNQQGQPPATAENEPTLKPLSNRSPVSFIAWIVVVGLIVAGVGLAAWWFGSGYYGATPWLIR